MSPRSSRRGDGLEGLLPVDKPPGPTSHDVVSSVRRVLDERRVGHTGTLDPFASGLLLLAVGRATRLVQFLDGLPKAYEATLQLGVETATGDPEGDVIARAPVSAVRDQEVESAMAGLRGPILQRPPVYSAKKVKGVAAHRRVRRGEAVELPEVAVEIHEFSLLARGPEAGSLRLRVVCSTGTYVRALARDLAHRLGTVGHLTSLRRTAIGDWQVGQAVRLPTGPESMPPREELARALVPPIAALGHLPSLEVGPLEARALVHGQSLPPGAESIPEGPVRVVHAGRLLAVGEEGERGGLRPRRVFLGLDDLLEKGGA